MALLVDVVPNSVMEIAQDERFLDNGNWIPVIDGYALPTVTEVEDNPQAANYSEVQTDARREPDAYLRYYQGNYNLRLHIASVQAAVLDRVLGLGSLRRNKSVTNKARTIGLGGASLPVQPGDNEWYLMKFADAGAAPVSPATAAFNILRTTFTDISAGWKACIYVPAAVVPAAFVAATDVIDVTAKTSLTNAYLGTFAGAGLTLPAAVTPDIPALAQFQYDPGRVYTVKTTVQTLKVDNIDPLLRTGDWCVIVGLGYKASQLVNDGDYSIVQPDGARTRVALDLYRPLGDTPNSDTWERRRYFNVEQTMMPAASTSGRRPDANERTYEFIVRELKSRFRSKWYGSGSLGDAGDPLSRFYETDFIQVG